MYTNKLTAILAITGLVGLTPVSSLAESNKPNPPAVPFQYGLGLQNYRSMCSACHGEWGSGSDSGPPLIHVYYKPSHHSDDSFYRAALEGVTAHHWNFGDMPPVENAQAEDIKPIVVFIRWLQAEYGI